MAKSLTACVITRDEEERLPACLESLRFCDEVVVVDSGSRDRTREIATAAGAKVVERPWPGFAAQRNTALDLAGGDWVLEIDADERVSPELARSLRAFLDGPPAGVTMAAIPMRELFLGKPLGPSIRYPRYRHRLFERGAFRHDESRTVHEGLWPDGAPALLEGDLIHLLASSWREAIADARAYARLEAEQRRRPGLRDGAFGIFVRPTVKLAYRMLVLGGWRDGWRGFARVGLECGADALATVRRLSHGDEEAGEGGFGQEQPRLGPVKLVGIATSARAERRLAPWLAEAAADGADVALVCADAASAGTPRRRRPQGSGPGAYLRALDAENQARPIDALVLPGARERTLARLAPAELRGAVAPLDPGAAGGARAAVDLVQRQSREPGPT